MLLLSGITMGTAAEDKISWKRAIDEMRSFTGSSSNGVDTSTLTGKIVVGYQGWFNTPHDGYGLKWKHYSNHGQFKPGAISVDYWPHTAEFKPACLEPTPFRKRDGKPAFAFSSTRRDVVDTHFKWMRQYGIEAAFLQRFAGPSVRDPGIFRNNNRVLDNVRAAANARGRAYAVMYDLSGLESNRMSLVKQDWKRLVDHMSISRDPEDRAYLHHDGRPLVAVWGAGFKGRAYTMKEILSLVTFLRDDPRYGGCTVMLGVPTGWRELKRDSIASPELHAVIRAAHIVSPWTPGRYRDLEGVERHAERYWRPDMAWCRKEGLDYLPVVFPGFSWANLKGNNKPDDIPRLGGRFLWKQYAELIGSGATMIYQAMFDEIDEGTQILKVDNDPPVGASVFLSYSPHPEDHYLWLVGEAQTLLSAPQSLSTTLPERKKH